MSDKFSPSTFAHAARETSVKGSYATWKLLLCLAMLPPLVTGVLVFKWGIDVPYYDQWELVPLFEKVARGNLTFGDLYVQHNEHRQLFPNLIFLVLGWLTRWNVRWEMGLIFALACLVSLSIYVLGERTISGTRERKACLYLLANLLIFSPAQYENWLFGVQVVYLVPVVCVLFCIFVARSDWKFSVKFALCMAASTVSSFSCANGLVCWLVALPLLLTDASCAPCSKFQWASVWMAGFAANVAFYFYHYHSLPYPNLNTLPLPLAASGYFLAVLGAPLSWGRLWISLLAGAAMLSAFALLCFRTWGMRKDGDLAARAMCWFALGMYSIITAALITFGRMSLGVEQAMASRYLGFSIYLCIATFYLVAMIAEGKGGGERPFFTRWIVPASAALALYIGAFSVVAAHHMRNWGRERLQAKACLLFINLLPNDCSTRTLYPNRETLRARANALNAMGFLRPALLRSLAVRDFAASDTSAHGSFDGLIRVGENRYLAFGQATLKDRPADAVLLACEDDVGHEIVFALAQTELIERFRETLFDRGEQRETHWQREFTLDELPHKGMRIKAWAFDANLGKAFPLHGVYEVGE